MSKITYRAFNGLMRLNTAIELKDGKILQVFPFKQIFDNIVAWKLACISASHFKTTGRRAVGTSRREAEFGELLSTEYTHLITSVQRISEDSLQLTFNDTSTATLTRSLDYSQPPLLNREGVSYLGGDKYKSTMTCAQWILICLFT